MSSLFYLPKKEGAIMARIVELTLPECNSILVSLTKSFMADCQVLDLLALDDDEERERFADTTEQAQLIQKIADVRDALVRRP